MSIRLRVRYQFRSVVRMFLSFRIPTFLTGTASKASIYALVIFLLVGYVSKISHLTTGGYEIASLEKKVAMLSGESEKLSAEVASYQSIASIQKRLPGISMVPAKNVNYIKLNSLVVAER